MATGNSLCVEEGLGALQAERRKDVLKAAWWSKGGRDTGKTGSFQEEMDSSCEGRAAQLNMCGNGEWGRRRQALETRGHWFSGGQYPRGSHVS